ncbi:uncharacterized protein [Pituophis catenifer annectens]|uniref:uncharacterized protein n=1 Tax=Pituophis catenifer annectens TaxID=94852 RepID=UPI003995B0C9
MALEILLRKIRDNKEIKGLQIKKEIFKIQAFADDVALIMEDPLKSGPKVLQEIQQYGEVAGFKLNKTKTKILVRNMDEMNKKRLEKSLELQITKKIKYLGIWITVSIMRKAGLDESKVRIKIAGRNINNLSYADGTTLMAESEDVLKSLLMQVKEESVKVSLKLNIKKTKIMASGPLNSWQIDGEEMEVVTDFIFLGSQITAYGDCSQEIKRRLLLGRKAMANLDSILKSRDITLPTKVCIVKAMVFPVATYGCESWTIRKEYATSGNCLHEHRFLEYIIKDLMNHSVV